MFIFISFVPVVDAQKKVCDLQLSVQEQISKESIKTANSTLENAEGKVSYANIVGDNLYFSDLEEGMYILAAWSEGYKTSLKRIKFVCDESSEQKIYKSIYLLKGNPNEKIHVIDKDFAIIQKSGMTGENNLALSLPKPIYPQSAIKNKISSKVFVEVLIDEKGKVESAKAIGGDSAFWKAAEDAAKEALFIPSVVAGKPVKVTGSIVYNFVP